MGKISSKTLSYLELAGWFPGRQVNITAYEKALKFEGFIVPEVAKSFLSEFGGLVVKFPLVDDRFDSFHFDAKKAVLGVDQFWAQEDYYVRLGNIKLCVIGEAYTDHLTLMMNEQGKVYGGYDDFLCEIGDSGIEAMDNICLNKTFKEVK